MNETEIDLSYMTVEEACLWLLLSLQTVEFEKYAYTLPFASYLLTWHKAVPLDSIIILQSPYPNPIFPPIAAAMSYDTDLCKQYMKGNEVPPTVEVLSNDLYINGGMSKEDSIAILKNGWALIDKGILMLNEAVFHMYNPGEAYIESVKQCSVIIRMLQETEKYGKRTVNIYAFGESGERVGSNICSWFKSPTVRLLKRKVTHPAGIARRFNDLSSPNCHMNTPSFSKALAKTFSNHVASMHIMARKPEQDLRSERLQNTYKTLTAHFPTVEESLTKFVQAQSNLLDMVDNPEYKDALQKVIKASDDLANRLRIANSIVTNVQLYGSSVAGTVSKSGPSMKTERPSQDLLSDHTGGVSETVAPIINRGLLIKSKTKRSTSSTIAKPESFTNVSSPPSVASVPSEIISPTASTTTSPSITRAPFVIKSKTSRANTPLKQTPDKITAETKDDSNTSDIVSPIPRKFTKKAVVPTSKTKPTESKQPTPTFNTLDVRMSQEQMNVLSSIQAIVETNKPDVVNNKDYMDMFDTIADDVASKMADNNITQRFVEAINKDLQNIPKFDINKWMSDTTDTCATFELCKEEFEF